MPINIRNAAWTVFDNSSISNGYGPAQCSAAHNNKAWHSPAPYRTLSDMPCSINQVINQVPNNTKELSFSTNAMHEIIHVLVISVQHPVCMNVHNKQCITPSVLGIALANLHLRMCCNLLWKLWPYSAAQIMHDTAEQACTAALACTAGSACMAQHVHNT